MKRLLRDFVVQAAHRAVTLQKTMTATSALQHDNQLRDAFVKHKGADKPLTIVITGLAGATAAKARGAQAQAAADEDISYSRPMVASSDTIVGPSHRSLGFWQQLATFDEFSNEIDAAFRKEGNVFQPVYNYLLGLPEQMENAKRLWYTAVVRLCCLQLFLD